MQERLKALDIGEELFWEPLRLVPPDPWVGHLPFAYWLIKVSKPAMLLELGTHTGNSYFAFCQALASLNTAARAYAVDTWQGDEHAGFYGDEILGELRRHHDPLYGKFSRLIQNTFDDAAAHFPNGGVTLLHIDGFHTYEAVRHDWETWSPKMASAGVVLFHDINVRERDFGVWRLWDELVAELPHFAFKHGHGLGVLAAGSEVPERLRWLFELDADAAATIHGFFFALGNRISLHAANAQLTALLQERQRALETSLRDYESKIERLQGALSASEHEAKRLAGEREVSLATIGDLQSALETMSKSSAVRASRMLRSISPGLHRMVGSVGKVLLPQNRR